MQRVSVKPVSKMKQGFSAVRRAAHPHWVRSDPSSVTFHGTLLLLIMLLPFVHVSYISVRVVSTITNGSTQELSTVSGSLLAVTQPRSGDRNYPRSMGCYFLLNVLYSILCGQYFLRLSIQRITPLLGGE